MMLIYPCFPLHENLDATQKVLFAEDIFSLSTNKYCKEITCNHNIDLLETISSIVGR